MKKIVTMEIEVNDTWDGEPLSDCNIEGCIRDVLECSEGNSTDFYNVEIINIEDDYKSLTIVELKEDQQAPMILRAEGGSAERTEPLAKIQIPDLWRLAMHLKEKGGYEHSVDNVLETWYLCHDLKKHIERNA